MKTFPSVSLVFVFLLPFSVTAQDVAVEAKQPGDAPTLPVAVVSQRSVFGDVNANLAHFTKLIEEAQARGARLICCPELALVSYSTNKDVLKSAESIPGPATKRLEAIARRLDVFISAGMAERDGERYYLAQVLVGPDGYLGKYRSSTQRAANKHAVSRQASRFRHGTLTAFPSAY